MKSSNPALHSTPEVNVGCRLRKLRCAGGLSIRALADQSGLNVNTLSFIENNKTSPSVGTLAQVAAALRVPITAFFETERPLQSIAFQKAGDRQELAFINGALSDLGLGLTSRGLAPFLVTLQPHAASRATPIVHTGLEFVYCLEGRLGYEVDGHFFCLDPGDSLLFEAHLPHRWCNDGEKASRSLLLLAPAYEGDCPDEKHFK